MTSSIGVSSVAVISFFLISVVIVTLTLHKITLPRPRKGLLLAAIVISFTAKIGLATAGHNFDVDSYHIVSTIVEQGKSVYANTDRYNYGPVWAWILSGLSGVPKLVHPDVPEGLHIMVAGFLGAIDTLIALALAVEFSSTAAILFLLSPVGILISGFHSQFDNFSLLLALLAWLIIRRGNPGRTALFASAVLMGLSLATKHLMFLFPIWLLFWSALGRPLRRISYAGIAYAVFLSSFLPWVVDAPSRAGILRNVFGYNGGCNNCGTPLLDAAVRSFLPGVLGTPPNSGMKLLWIGLMVVAGLVSARRNSGELFLQYTMALYALTPAFGDQYAAIPLIACAILYPIWWSSGFIATATIALLTSPYNIFAFLYHAPFTLGVGSYKVILTDQWLWLSRGYMIVLGQLLLAALLLVSLRGSVERTETRSGEAELCLQAPQPSY